LPTPDEAASKALAEELFGCEMVTQESTTFENADPRGKSVLVGVYPSVTLVAANALAIDVPSEIDPQFIKHGQAGRMTLHAQHSVSDWTAFAWWEEGALKRSLSVAPDNGIIEDIGEKLSFEATFWSPSEQIYPPEANFPYGHPLELGELALVHFIGTQYEGYAEDWLWDTFDLRICAFKKGRKIRSGAAKPFWKIW
jgi:hypothetical protein